MIAASPISPDEYAMRIATQTESGHGKTRYRSSSRLCRVSSDFSRCLPPVSSGLHTCHTAAFLQLPNDSTSGKSIQMSSNRLIIRYFSLRQQLGVILTAIRRAISLPEILILHRQHAFILLRHSPLRLPAYLRMCYRTSPYLIS
ncbi:hypothetical protein TNCV_1058901 [Trichonephila clavipes]|nr:hypothetical protein TNCV_1058901 [Trichonephila clavipes]